MKNTATTRIFRKLIWMIGFLLLVFGSISIKQHFKELASSTFNPTAFVWVSSMIAIVIGGYIALLFIKQAQVKLNRGLFLFVTIPCLLLTLFYPILTIVPSVTEPIPLFMSASFIQFASQEIFGVVAGLTLVLSIFKQKNN